MKNKNYFLSGWIENLGVVPLFLFAAFLLRPLFFLRLTLLILVTHVFETMIQLQLISLKRMKIGYMPLKVNHLAWSLTIFQLLSCSPAVGFETKILSKGEHLELLRPELTQYTNSSSEVIKTRWEHQTKQLLIKGEKLGFSELIIWNKKSKEVYKFYVLSKKEHLKLVRSLELLNREGIKAELVGNLISVNSKIQNLHQYLIIQKLLKSSKKIIYHKSSLSKQLQKEIIAKIYLEFQRSGLKNYSCYFENIQISCSYSESFKITKDLKKYFHNKYLISFTKKINRDGHQNFLVKLMIYQIERTDGEEIGFGLDKLNLSPFDIMDKGLKSLIEGNRGLLNLNHLKVSTLATPEIIMQLNQPAEVQLGSDIPFNNSQGENAIISWKFAGLKLNLKLNEAYSGYQIQYVSELLRPSTGATGTSLSGSKNKSHLNIKIGRPVNLFSIGIKTQNDFESRLPFISKTPLLGSLFTSSSESNNYKHIIALIELKKL